MTTADPTFVTLADLVESHSDFIGELREEMRTQLYGHLDGLSTMQNNGIPRRGPSYDDPIQVRFDHRVLDDIVVALAKVVAKKVLEQRVPIAREAPLVAVPLADVIAADPLLRELLDTTGTARVALGSMDLQIQSGSPPDRIPLSLVAWSRMVDAYRQREGRPPLKRIETKHVPSSFLTPAQYDIDCAAQKKTSSDRESIERELAELEADPVHAFVPTTKARDERAKTIELRTREAQRMRVLEALKVDSLPTAAIDAVIAAVTDVPCVDERCPRCHHVAPNPVGCALCNPAELGRRLKNLTTAKLEPSE